MSTLVGMCLNGRYRLDARIGSGGMSTVYRAFDITLERPVAVKLMHREIASDSDQLERFRREARAVAQLSHPHIVGVIDAGEEDGRPYIVFEYVEGETLKGRIRRMGRLPIDEAIAYAIEIARALGAAHARGIVHRDIKPQNVLVDEEGSAKVTDFGIARSLDEDGLTADGRVLGTTDYVSPEQALGHDVNGQSDLYSLGVVMFEMLTGDVPFHGENQVAVAMKHVREDMPDVQRAAAAGLRRARGAARPADGQGPAAPLPGRGHAWSPTSRRRSPARRRARAPRPARPPRCCARCRRTSSGGSRCGCAGACPCSCCSCSWPSSGGVALYVLIDEGVERTQRGTGPGRVEAPPGDRIISVKRTSAHDFDPLADQAEHHEVAPLAVDQDPGTRWTTETYTNDVLNKPRGDARRRPLRRRGAARRRQRGRDPDAGARLADGALRRPLAPARGRVAERRVAARRRRPRRAAQAALRRSTRGGRSYRYYLVWITAAAAGRGARGDHPGDAVRP